MVADEELRIQEIRARFEALRPVLDERQVRLWAAAEAKALGHGGVATVTRATGIRSKRICNGMQELEQMAGQPPEKPARRQRVRRSGAGRKKTTAKDPALLRDLEAPVDPATRGGPESPLRWTSKSVAHLTDELRAQGHEVGETTVRSLLKEDLEFRVRGRRRAHDLGRYQEKRVGR